VRTFDDTPLAFLTSLSAAARSRGMDAEVRAALAREMKSLGSGTWSTFFRILSRPRESDAAKIAYFEKSYQNIPTWISNDATCSLTRTLRDNNPFVLYLRAYASESVQELAGSAGGVSIFRSIEVANLSMVSERIPVYGLCNALDMNPLRKYQSVWLPPDFRNRWEDIVRELANRSILIVINATRPGSGLSIELKIIPRAFPEKTWLLAGTVGDEGGFATSGITCAAEKLKAYVDHVSKAAIANGAVHDAWPRFPKWVQEIVTGAKGTAC
jgi:hypothetical protein